MEAQAPLMGAAAGAPRPAYFHTVSLGLLVFLPIICFTLILCLITFFYNHLPVLDWCIVVLTFGLSFMFMAAKQRDGARYWFNLGVLCSVATSVAIIFGLWNHYRNMNKFWMYEGQRSYTNVLPSEPALQRLDAGKIQFSVDAHVDVGNKNGYKHGDVYCVAPIIGKAAQTTIEYWAAGVNCCEQTGNFTCGDVTLDKARAGLVFLNEPPFPEESLTMFRKAATASALAAKSYNVSQDALFVRWVLDPDEAQQLFWADGIQFMVCCIIVYSAISLVLGVLLHFTRRPPVKSKLDPRRY